MTSAVVHTPRRKRPLLVWFIFLFYGLSAPYVLLRFWLIYSGKLATMLPPNERTELAHLVENFSIFDILITVLLGTIETIAAVFLFRLRTVAIQLFAAALALKLALSLRRPLNWFELEGFIILLATLIYAVRLKRRGALFYVS